MKKRLLTITSVFLVFCMLFTAFPVAAATVDGNGNENSASVDNNMTITSNNSVGAMIADAVGEEQDKQEENQGVNIFSVSVTIPAFSQLSLKSSTNKSATRILNAM